MTPMPPAPAEPRIWKPPTRSPEDSVVVASGTDRPRCIRPKAPGGGSGRKNRARILGHGPSLLNVRQERGSKVYYAFENPANRSGSLACERRGNATNGQTTQRTFKDANLRWQSPPLYLYLYLYLYLSLLFLYRSQQILQLPK